MKKVLNLLLVIVSFLGVLDATFLTHEKLSGYVPPCSTGFSCETVLTSKYSSLGPIPLSAFGIVYYVGILVVCILLFLDVDHRRIGTITIHTRTLLLATLFGIAFSAYLVFVMGFVLKAWCLYCLFSALCCFTLFIGSYLYHWVRRKDCTCEASRIRVHIVAYLYRLFAKPIFFHFDPESIHVFMTHFGRLLGESGVGRHFVSWLCMVKNPKQSFISLDGLQFAGRVGLSAGFDWKADLTNILPSVGFGFMSVGTITRLPTKGNQAPRLARFPHSKALLVNKGFMNPGAQVIIKKLKGQHFAVPLGISIGNTNTTFTSLSDQIQDIVECFVLFENVDMFHAFYELNISCPNLTTMGSFIDHKNLKKLLLELQKLDIQRPIYVKMPIDETKIVTNTLLTTLSKFTFIRGVIFGNLTKDHTNPDIDEADRKLWSTMKGNLSGKPTWNRSNALIAFTKKTFKSRFTIIGTGGIFSPEDALEKRKLGADLVQIITGMIYVGPQLIGQIDRLLSP